MAHEDVKRAGKQFTNLAIFGVLLVGIDPSAWSLMPPGFSISASPPVGQKIIG